MAKKTKYVLTINFLTLRDGSKVRYLLENYDEIIVTRRNKKIAKITPIEEKKTKPKKKSKNESKLAHQKKMIALWEKIDEISGKARFTLKPGVKIDRETIYES